MYRIVLLLSAVSIAFAEAAGPGAPAAPDAPAGAGPAAVGAAPSMIPSILLMVGIVVFMYFVMIRPQRKEEARRKEMLAALKRGDQVTTIGGAHGVIETVGEQTIDVRIGSGDKTLVVTFNKGAVNGNLTAEQAVADQGKK
jgi:preprotein translocase subunit YajC